MCISAATWAQVDTTLVRLDSTIIPSLRDSLPFQSSQLGYEISKDAITEEIQYGAADSNWTSIVKDEIHLYGKAYVHYQKVKITADYIVFNFDTKVVKAYGIPDEKGRLKNPPKFTDGDTEATYEEMTYNFGTKKAIVKKIITQESDFFVLGDKAKYIAADSINPRDRFFLRGSRITTCNLPHPHFGIRATKLKFIPNEIAVIGPANLEIAGVPTPLLLPFGFFPLIQGASSGLIFPRNYDYNPEFGLGLREIGYYFPINDYLDLRVTGDIYSRGTHGVRVASNYKKRYKYSGNINLGYNNALIESRLDGRRESAKSFSININHNQDAKAHPYRTVGGSINISSNQFDRRTFNDPTSVLTNSYRSNFNYNYRWPESPFKVSVGLSHNQETQTRVVNLTLPEANLNMNTITPFKRKNQIGDPKWYENINLGYNASLRNYVRATDTTLFSQATLDNLQTGLSQRANLSFNARALKYFSINPSVNYEEIWFVRTRSLEFDPTLDIRLDTIGTDELNQPITRSDTIFGRVIERLKSGFAPYRRVDMGIAITTQIFGSRTFSKGWLRGVRHILKPTISLNYSPDTRDRYTEIVNTDVRPEFNNPRAYNPFEGGIFGASLNPEQMNLRYDLNSVFEAKYYSKKDSTEKKIKLFDNLRVSGFYNIAADSFRWSNVNIAGNTSFFNGLSVLNITAEYSPYVHRNGVRQNQLLWDQSKKLIELRRFSSNLNTGFSLRQLRQIFLGEKEGDGPKAANNPTAPTQQRKQGSSLGEITDNFRISHNIGVQIEKNRFDRDTVIIGVNSIQLSGSLQISKNWLISIQQISYDFKSKSFIYPSFSFARDLHCWQMNIGWFPSRDVYSFFIGVKSNAFSFFKYEYGQQNPGAFFGR